ncbi:hypothetical protein [Natronoglycomyces albus]|uniref:Uncharacterized protein n=1 Tax=Natronoglycomyces albus TaxID=2811108 RepID=A0A895XJU7_9ACTN|nr:hypothetical protein [Natronoglycomyces albus]QSB06031.1 hypothetical protein JQS30_03655 [Natronoglycomyces albus]
MPLDDLLMLVSGDPDSMSEAADPWNEARDLLAVAGQETDNIALTFLSQCSSEDTSRAREVVHGLAEALRSMGKISSGIVGLLRAAQFLATATYEIIKDILAELAKWLIIKGLIALAAAYPTAGAPIVKFGIGAKIKSLHAFLKGYSKYDKASDAYMTLKEALLEAMGDSITQNLNDLVRAVASGTVGDLIGDLRSAPANAGEQDNSLKVIDGDTFRSAGEGLSGLASDMEPIRAKAAEVRVIDVTWRLCGLQFAAAYFAFQDLMATMFRDTPAAYLRGSENLHGMAESWEEADAQGAQDLLECEGMEALGNLS